MKKLIIILALVLVFIPAVSLAIDSVKLTETDIKQIREAKKQIEIAEQKLVDIQLKILKRELPFRSNLPDYFLRNVIDITIHNGKLYCTYNEGLTSEQIKDIIYYQKDEPK